MAPRTEYEIQREVRAKTAARGLVDAASTLGFDAKAFAEAIRMEHRTVQQNVGRVVIELLHQWAGDLDRGNYDLRNEDIVRASADLIAGVEDDLPGLRHI